MRGDDGHEDGMWSYVSAEQRVPADHPLRRIRALVDEVLERLSPRFAELYSKVGRPSIPPERLLRALLLQVLYTIRSERMLMEQLDYNLLFRWFVGLRMDDPIWDPTVFTKNRGRLLEGEIAQAFFQEVLALASEKNLTSDEHFTVDGTLIEAWAGHKSFRPRPGKRGKGPQDPGGSSGEDFHGQTRSNATHQIDDRPRSAPGPQGLRERGQAQLPGACSDGEPQRSGDRRSADPGRRDGGAVGGGRDASRDAGQASWPDECGSGQGVRHPGLRFGVADDGDHPARGAERHEPPECD